MVMHNALYITKTFNEYFWVTGAPGWVLWPAACLAPIVSVLMLTGDWVGVGHSVFGGHIHVWRLTQIRGDLFREILYGFGEACSGYFVAKSAFVFKNAIFTAKSDIFFIEMQQIFFKEEPWLWKHFKIATLTSRKFWEKKLL